MISATHGAEGFCGSGAQVDWLRRGESSRLPNGVAVLMIHAINPYGFAWLRRVTHENVDLNRNWVDFDAPLPGNPGYDELAEAIVPASWTDEAQAKAAKVLGAYAEANGFMGLQQALSGAPVRSSQAASSTAAAPGRRGRGARRRRSSTSISSKAAELWRSSTTTPDLGPSRAMASRSSPSSMGAAPGFACAQAHGMDWR